MKAALQESLYERYPLMFRDLNLLGARGRVSWGIECADGWYALLDGLCDVLSRRVHGGLCPAIDVVQVKEKFGSLRFYFKGGDDYARGAVRLACALSCFVCEETGRPGRLMTTDRGLRTLADDIGRGRGYRPVQSNTPSPREFDPGAGMASVPDGWRAIAVVLNGVVTEDAPGADIRLEANDTGLSIGIQNGTELTEGAGDCARAVAARTNAETGAMRIPV